MLLLLPALILGVFLLVARVLLLIAKFIPESWVDVGFLAGLYILLGYVVFGAPAIFIWLITATSYDNGRVTGIIIFIGAVLIFVFLPFAIKKIQLAIKKRSHKGV
ncbi:hypothetical protein ACFQY8_00330 [Alloscardovia venturai]|uniref:Uncharacterized protein n=1 Tax=Alloscardovia venturai TaxID=1769421 RepID=A0ABW2Y1S6_9BIFI